MPHINRLKKKSHIIITNDAEIALKKTQHPFKILQNYQLTKMERNFLNFMKVIYKKPTSNVIFNSERLNAFSLRSGTK